LSYQLSATVTQSRFGVQSWAQYIAPVGASLNSPFSLAWLGSWSFNVAGTTVTVDSSQIIPALIVLFVFCCFSVLNAYVGAFLATCSAAILTMIGWLAVPTAAVTAAFVLCFMLGIVYSKRRGG
jgi:uncharacterized membrane protein (DUF485 family)